MSSQLDTPQHPFGGRIACRLGFLFGALQPLVGCAWILMHMNLSWLVRRPLPLGLLALFVASMWSLTLWLALGPWRKSLERAIAALLWLPFGLLGVLAYFKWRYDLEIALAIFRTPDDTSPPQLVFSILTFPVFASFVYLRASWIALRGRRAQAQPEPSATAAGMPAPGNRDTG